MLNAILKVIAIILGLMLIAYLGVSMWAASWFLMGGLL